MKIKFEIANSICFVFLFLFFLFLFLFFYDFSLVFIIDHGDIILLHLHELTESKEISSILDRLESFFKIKLQVSLQKKTLAQVFSCKFCEVFNNTFFTEHLRVTASGVNTICISGAFRTQSNVHARAILSSRWAYIFRGKLKSTFSTLPW